MNTLPQQLLAQRLDAEPAQVWPRLLDSGFIASLLGLQLPSQKLAPGQCLRGHDEQQQAVALFVAALQPSVGLTLRLQRASQPDQALHLALQPLAPGSRLTVLHQAWGGDAWPAVPADANLAAWLRQPLPARLQAGAPDDDAALALARDHLAQMLPAVQALLRQMAPHQGYQQAAGGGFSLAAQLWHLADIETLGWVPRFRRVLDGEHQPDLPGVDGDALAIRQRYQQRPWRGAARRFLAQRQRTLALLARCDAALLARPLRFAGQPARLANVLAALLAHDQEHRLQMAALWPPAPESEP